ncbi:MAG: site-specific integrase, partial [archaeon]|nr:site-specific integrase [archaeon]
MEKTSLKTFSSIKNLREVLRNKDASIHTYKNYIKSIRRLLQVFPEFNNNPDIIIQRIQSGEIDEIELFKRFIDFFKPEDWNKPWKTKKETLRLWLAGIKKFLRANDIKVYSEDIRDLMPKISKRRKWEESPTKDELRELYNYLSLRGKLVLALISGSGLRIGTILKLQMRDIDLSDNPSMLQIPYSVIENDEVIKKMKGATSDDQGLHIGWITPEAKDYLESYIAYRKRNGEVITPESPVITFKVWNTPRGERKEKLGDFTNHWTLWRELRLAIIKSGIDKNLTEWRGKSKYHPHFFRAYFRTMLTQAGLSEPDIAVLMGHEASVPIGWNRTNEGNIYLPEYYKPKMEYLKEQYKKAIPLLSVYDGSIERSTIEMQAKKIEQLSKEKE